MFCNALITNADVHRPHLMRNSAKEIGFRSQSASGLVTRFFSLFNHYKENPS